MTAFQSLPAIPHLEPIFAAIAAANPHDGQARADSIDPRRSLALLAPAGSGKTTQLLFRMLACLTVVERPEEILAITFTTKAAGEILERVTSALSLAAAGVEPVQAHEKPLYQLGRLVLERDRLLGWNLILNPSRLRIMTFDAFCAYLAGKTPIMSGLGGGKTVEDPALIYRSAILDTLGSVNSDDIPEELREALEAVLTFARNRFELLVPMFSALLSKRDQWAGEIMTLDIPGMELAIAEMVAKHAAEAITVLGGSPLTQAMDILQHASGVYDGFAWAAQRPALAINQTSLDYLRGFAGFALTSENTLRKSVNVKNGFPAGEPLTKDMNALLKGLKDDPKVELYSEALVTLKTLPDLQYPQGSAAMCQHFTVILRYLLANLTLTFDGTATIDFQEVAQRAIQSLGFGDEVGDALLDEDRINHLMVDEFQDTSPSQFELLQRLVAHWEDDDSRSVFFCGDGFQSIYLFRAATVELFINMVMSKVFGPKSLEIHRLTVNFRSAPGVVEWNNRAYGKVFAKSDFPFVPSIPFRTVDGGVHIRPITTGPIGEAQEVVNIIKEALAKNPEQTIAILVRGRSHLKHILPALKEAGIPTAGQNIDPIAESAPVSEVIALIRALWHAADRTSWLAMLRSAFVGLSWDDCRIIAQGGKVIRGALNDDQLIATLSPDGQVRVERLNKVMERIERSARGTELVWAAKAAWVALGGPATVDSVEMADVETVFRVLAQHTSNGALQDPQAFFRALDNLYASPKAGVVQVMTIHNAKGLEYDSVILPGLNRTGATDDTPLFYWRNLAGTFALAPNVGDQDESSPESRLFKFIGRQVKKDILDEVSRLAYVGTTRAKCDCYLLAAVDKFDEDKPIRVASGSLLSCLWPELEEDFYEAEPGVPITADVSVEVPSKARLSASFTVELPRGIFIPAASNDQIPTENELADELREEEGNDYRAKTIGVVYHRVVELISKEGIEAWSIERLQTKKQAIAALLRREGYPAAEVPAGVARIHHLVERTISSTHGRWILKKRESGGQEVQVSSYRNSRWVHRYLDRPFVDDGVYWIIDWKTPDCPEGMPVEQFLSREVNRYAPKMREYKQAVQDAGVTLPVKLALFLPAVDRLVEVA
ncbi:MULTISPECIES: UvrD-helicase domain-containing protein [Pseudomonas]|uniref:DNA 3'-5' helicase n=12 Tax=Pseudomonas TaxID=286 RepID=A0A223Q3E6_PSEPU|nr:MULTISPECIES: UvrD-helicase domain-containing protein [Pseudomonas]AVX92599.1 DNA helicase UvrD [Pseudomonas koreensis]ASU52144.1 Hypothetical protein [Pseudomonas putida]AVE20342.1 ATP-dependent DNA helicase pcrA [Pseudomonas aeruginosa]AVE20870.1 ATP-dependent DNA helicase pcrA [Pseudomonas aeruginosa]AVE21464.1 ATP-dependent DNA helicase PcrA [Pseudomonas aeruginosa]